MIGHRITCVVALVAGSIFAGGCATAPLEPVNVAGGVFFNQMGGQAHAIYTVPAGKLLIIDDASAHASNSSTASTVGNPGVVKDMPVEMSLRTNPSGIESMGSADHVIVSEIGLPAGGGRRVRAYAAPGTQVLFLIGGNTVTVNATVHFAGRLVDYP
ncbi:MAG: hypothetical protein WBD40_10660 [Tepidisphaeraceae bacterium]